MREFKTYSESAQANADGLLERFEKFKPIRNSSLILSILTLSFYNKTEYLIRDNARTADPDWLVRVLNGFAKSGVYYAEIILPMMEDCLRKLT